MADSPPTIADIIAQLPQTLQLRFNALGGYIQGIIIEEEAGRGARLDLRTDELQLIQLAAFIYAIDGFFRTGSRSARLAATTFRRFGAPGFQVGSTVFTASNDNTWRGERLADGLRTIVASSRLGPFLAESSSMRELVLTIVREMRP